MTGVAPAPITEENEVNQEGWKSIEATMRKIEPLKKSSWKTPRRGSTTSRSLREASAGLRSLPAG